MGQRLQRLRREAGLSQHPDPGEAPKRVPIRLEVPHDRQDLRNEQPSPLGPPGKEKHHVAGFRFLTKRIRQCLVVAFLYQSPR